MTDESDIRIAQLLYEKRIEAGLQPLEAYLNVKATVGNACKLDWKILTFEVVSCTQQSTASASSPPVHSSVS